MQHDLLQKNNHLYLLTQCRGRGCIKGQNICLHFVLCFIPANLVYNNTTFEKKKNNSFDPFPGIKGVFTGKLFASVLLYASFSFICYLPYSEKGYFFKIMGPLQHCHFWPGGGGGA